MLSMCHFQYLKILVSFSTGLELHSGHRAVVQHALHFDLHFLLKIITCTICTWPNNLYLVEKKIILSIKKKKQKKTILEKMKF